MQKKISANENIGRRALALFLLAAAVFFARPSAAAAGLPEGVVKNSRQGLDETTDRLRLDRFLIKPEPHRGCNAPPSELASGSFEYGFQGREADSESGLQHFRARSYDPMTGRFTSRDPVWAPNLYLFVNNDPVNRTDPLGLFDPKGLFEEFAKQDKDGKGKARLARFLKAGYTFESVDDFDVRDDVDFDHQRKVISLDPDLYDHEGAEDLLEELEDEETSIGGLLQGLNAATNASARMAEELGIEGFETLYTQSLVNAGAIGKEATDAIVRETILFAVSYVGGRAIGAVIDELATVRGVRRAFGQFDYVVDPKRVAHAQAEYKRLLTQYTKETGRVPRVVKRPAGVTNDAYIDIETGVITIFDDVPEASRAGYLVEELHHFGQLKKRGWLGRTELTAKEIDELEAEVVDLIKGSGFIPAGQ